MSWTTQPTRQKLYHCPKTFLTTLNVTGLQLFSGMEIVTGVKNTVGIHSGLDENVWAGTEDESAVGSIQLQELLPALSMWISSAEPLPLSYRSYCMSLCAL